MAKKNNSISENEKNVNTIKEAVDSIIKSVKNLKQEVAGFTLEVQKDYSLKVSRKDGFSIVYPMLASEDVNAVNKTWFILTQWLANWNEDSMHAVAGFVGFIMYPAAMALSFDEEFINSVKDAALSAMKRDIESHKVTADIEAENEAKNGQDA